MGGALCLATRPPCRSTPSRWATTSRVMCKSIFQAGMSWRVVESKWPELRKAFRGFDADTVANLSEAELDELTSDRRVIRNRRKIEAVVQNARRMLDLEAEHGSFRNYLRSPRHLRGNSDRSAKAVQVPWRHRVLHVLVRRGRGGASSRGVDGASPAQGQPLE